MLECNASAHADCPAQDPAQTAAGLEALSVSLSASLKSRGLEVIYVAFSSPLLCLVAPNSSFAQGSET